MDDVADIYTKDSFHCASSILAHALKKLRQERVDMAEYVRDLVDQLATARLLYSEAVIAEREVERLLKGDLFTGDHQDPDEVEALEISSAIKVMLAEDGEIDLNDTLWNGMLPECFYPTYEGGKRYVHPVALAPEPTTITKSPQTGRPPKGPSSGELAAARIEPSLEMLWGMYPAGELDAGKVAHETAEPLSAVYAGLRVLADAGKIQYAQRKDQNRLVVLRPGETLPLPEVTEKQQACLDVLKRFADNTGRVQISFRKLAASSPLLVAGTVSQIVDALAHKGFLKIVDRGNAVRPSIYQLGRPPVRRATSGDAAGALMGDPAPDRSATTH